MIAVVCKFLLHDSNTIGVELALPSQQVDKIVESCLIIPPSQLCEIVNSLLAILIFLSHYIISTSDPVLKKVSSSLSPIINHSISAIFPILLAKSVNVLAPKRKINHFFRN